MNNYFKFLITFVAIVAIGYGGYTVYDQTVFHNLFDHINPITAAVYIAIGAAVVYGVVKGLIYLWNTKDFGIFGFLLFALILVTTSSCQRAKSNQQVVISDNCGEKWEMVNAGEAVPYGTGNPCFMKVIMPNYPMQGDMIFIANLKNKVKVNTEIDYDYSITNGLEFIKQAKFLGKSNQDTDSEAAIGSTFEQAENSVIDKRIKDVAKHVFEDTDIIDVDLSDLEGHLLVEINKILDPLGVQLNFLTLTFIPDEQTRQAIDIATAMRIYKANDLEDIGKLVMAERAGATKIVIEQSQPKSE